LKNKRNPLDITNPEKKADALLEYDVCSQENSSGNFKKWLGIQL
jgi:hypothetical protein